jgi:hypothetical protein
VGPTAAHGFIIKNRAAHKATSFAESRFGTLRLMKSATEHYAHHLGPVYSWMVGDLEAASARAAAELDALGLPGRQSVRAS